MVNALRSKKLVEIYKHCACAIFVNCGNARLFIDHANVEAQNHSFNFNEGMSVEMVA